MDNLILELLDEATDPGHRRFLDAIQVAYMKAAYAGQDEPWINLEDLCEVMEAVGRHEDAASLRTALGGG